MLRLSMSIFFFNDTATPEIYTLSLHDALPICGGEGAFVLEADPEPDRLEDGPVEALARLEVDDAQVDVVEEPPLMERSEEHTSELQLRQYLVCRLLLEKKKISRMQHSA